MWIDITYLGRRATLVLPRGNFRENPRERRRDDWHLCKGRQTSNRRPTIPSVIAIFPRALLCISAGDDLETLQVCCNLSRIATALARAVRDFEDISIEKVILPPPPLPLPLLLLRGTILSLAIVATTDRTVNRVVFFFYLLAAVEAIARQHQVGIFYLLAAVEAIFRQHQVGIGLPLELFSLPSKTFSDRVLVMRPSLNGQ